VLLRNRETGQYFEGGGKWWTDNAKQALNFERSEQAVEAGLGTEAQAMEVIVEVDEKRFNVPAGDGPDARR